MEWRVSALMALGRMDQANRELAATRELALQTRQPFILHVAEHYRSALSLLTGDLHEAEQAAERSREWGRLLIGRDASGVYGVQMFGVRREQGRLAELAPVIRVLAQDGGGGGAWRPALAATLAELEMDDQVREQLDRVRAEGWSRCARRCGWPRSPTSPTLRPPCATRGSRRWSTRRSCRTRARNVMVGHGVACYGAADRYLGMLASTLGEREACRTALRAGARVQPPHGSADMAGAHRLRVWADAARRRGSGARPAPAGRGGRARRDRGHAGAARPCAAAARHVPVPDLPDGLSPREVEVLRLAARGMSNREIGSSLFISEHTAANHMRSILRKTSCANRAEATAYAYERGLARR